MERLGVTKLGHTYNSLNCQSGAACCNNAKKLPEDAGKKMENSEDPGQAAPEGTV